MAILSSNGDYVFRPEPGTLTLQFPLPPDQRYGDTLKFHLTSTSGPAYDSSLSVVDDTEYSDDDEILELMFQDLPTNANFSLEVDPGNGKPKYFLFKDRPYAELVQNDE